MNTISSNINFCYTQGKKFSILITITNLRCSIFLPYIKKKFPFKILSTARETPKQDSPMDSTPENTSVGQPAKAYIHQLWYACIHMHRNYTYMLHGHIDIIAPRGRKVYDVILVIKPYNDISVHQFVENTDEIYWNDKLFNICFWTSPTYSMTTWLYCPG